MRAFITCNKDESKEDAIVRTALNFIEEKLSKYNIVSDPFCSPKLVKDFLRAKLATKEHEVFAIMFLDTQNRLISYEEMFTGTINKAYVHIREIAKRALALNAAGIIMSHNHPSGSLIASDGDRQITTEIIKALNIFEIKTLDHIIVSGQGSMSFAEHGLLW